MTYSDNLYFFGKWYLQLWAESIGKKGVGITPIHAIGTTDQLPMRFQQEKRL